MSFAFCLKCREVNVYGYGCDVTNIKSDFLIQTPLKDVRWMNLTDCVLEDNPEKTFQNYKQMKFITISNCTRLGTVDKPYFGEEIKYININGTEMTKINDKMFSTLLVLKYLYANSNKIEFINKDAFKDLKNVEIIDLRNNVIESLDDQTFANNIELKYINLSGNKIKIITSKLFANNRGLSNIQMKDNLIDFIQIGFNNYDIALMNFSNNLCINKTLREPKRLNRFDLFYCFLNYEMKLLNEKFIRNLTNISVEMKKLREELQDFNTTFKSISKQSDEEYEKVLLNLSSKNNLQIIEKVDNKFRMFSEINKSRIEAIIVSLTNLSNSKAMHDRIIYSVLILIVVIVIVGALVVYKKVYNNIPRVRYFEGDIHLL